MTCSYSAQLPSGRPSKRKARCLDDGFSTILELGGSEFVPSSNWDDSFDGLDGNNDDIVPAPTDPSAGAWATPPDDFSNMLMSDMFMHPTLPGHSHHSDYASLIIDEAGRRQQPSCSCFGLVQGCLLDVRSRDSTSTSLELLQMLRRARETTEKILKCSTCFHMEKTTVEGGGNILLLGHLVSTIASAYADFFNIVNTSADLGVKKSFTIGDADHVDQTMQVELSGNPYRDFMCSAYKRDIDALTSICDGFKDRQWRRHTQGHENCQPGRPCSNRASRRSRDPSDACPHEEDPSKLFPCFSIVEQAAVAVRRVHRIMS